MDTKMFLHVDLDAFFASVEVLDNPELKGKPLIVGGLPGERRSVVSTCSYEARKYGVHSAMPVNRAYELCPDAIFVHGRMERYHEKSQEVMSVFHDFSPDVLQMSIDEAFIDITGTELLFGDPLSLAKKLKQQVLEKTGLTVSVGIATNRYVAKIASGLKKPDGLCYVPVGKEEDFMLSLPLDKLWGIGSKSRERLNACGIFTIPEIHAISENALKELFGEASGSFLYRSVRGMDVEHFNDEAKSRSMSAERTFCFDLTDIYSIETELLHLSYDVMFRVLKEKVNSRTVCLKIRYEDFTTVTVSESSSRIVSSIEDLFERACRLFHKKAERGRGIRLLGLGLQNLSDGLESDQQELFDFGEKKQRSVEKAVLKLHQKDPSTKLKKARQLITPLLAFFFMFNALQSVHADSGGIHQDDIEFEVSGSWDSLFSGTTSVIIGGPAPVLSVTPPVFMQKANLSLWFLYDRHWYFEADVSTDSKQNMVAAGYMGEETIQEIRVGTDIGNDSQSPGVLMKFQGENWNADAQVHLDGIQTHSKTWKASSELVSSSVSISDFRKGFLFALPDVSATSEITGIYIEDSSGSYSDAQGLHYRRLSQSEYMILPSKSLVYIEKPVNGVVIAEISSKQAMKSRLSSFISDVYTWFDDCGAESLYTLMGLSYTGGGTPPDTEPFFTSLSGNVPNTVGMYLSRPRFFSPFQVSSLYTSSGRDSTLLSIDTNQFSADYAIPILTNDDIHLIQLYTTGNDERYDYTKAESRFPAARSYPWIYTAAQGVTERRVPVITETSSEKADRLSIGTSAVENSIQVLKNGMPVPARYERETGEIIILSGYSQNDTITVIWNEYSESSEEMTLTAAASFSITPDPFLTASGKLSSQFVFDPATRKLSTSPEAAPVISLSNDIRWERPFGNITLSLSNSFSGNASLPSHGTAPLVTFSGTGYGEILFLEGTSSNSSSITLSSSRRPGKSGYTVSIDGTLQESSAGTPSRYAVDIPLSSGASVLPSAQSFSFSMTDSSTSSSSLKVYLQIGDIDKDTPVSISTETAATWLISSSPASQPDDGVISPFSPMMEGAQKVTILLSDADRQKLMGKQALRLIIENTSETDAQHISFELTGLQNAAGGISYNVRAVNAAGNSIQLPVSVTETSLPAPLPEEFRITGGESTSSAAAISWNTAEAASGDIIYADRCFPSLSAAQYRKASVLIFVPEDSSATDVTVNLLKWDESGFETAESFSISKDSLASKKGNWVTLSHEISTDSPLSAIQFVLQARPENEEGTISVYFGGVFISEPVSTFIANNETEAGIRWTSGPLSAALTASLSEGGTFISSITDHPADTSLTSSVSAEASSPFISLSGQGTFDLHNPKLLSGEYVLSSGRNFAADIISFSDSARFMDATQSVIRKDTLSLSLVPLSIPFSVSSSLETDRERGMVSEKASLSAESLYSAGTTSASLSLIQTNAPYSSFSYSGNADAQSHTESAGFKQEFIIADGFFTPSLEIGFNTSVFKDRPERTGSFNQKLTLPLKINSDRLSFIYARETKTDFQGQSGTATFTDDIRAYTDAFSPHLHTLAMIPVYDLFTNTLSDTLQDALKLDSDTSAGTYITSGTIIWNRPLRAQWLDLVIPNTASFTASRTVSFAGADPSDRKTGSLFLAFTAFNCFGSSSASEFFDWYQQDEFQYSVRLTAGPQTRKTDITGYCTLYFNDTASFTSFYSGSFSDSQNSDTFQFSWIRPAVLFGKAAVKSTTGSVSIKKDIKTSEYSSDASFSHKADIHMNDNFTMYGNASVAALKRTDLTLTVTLSIGGKLSF